MNMLVRIVWSRFSSSQVFGETIVCYVVFLFAVNSFVWNILNMRWRKFNLSILSFVYSFRNLEVSLKYSLRRKVQSVKVERNKSVSLYFFG